MASAHWITDFNTELKAAFGIDANDAGLEERDFDRYADLSAREAAMAFGEDYDLDRIDHGWR